MGNIYDTFCTKSLYFSIPVMEGGAEVLTIETEAR